jgi:tetratricopeptide (TPR) repeat protein
LLYRDGYQDLDTAAPLLARAIDSDDAQLAALARLHCGCVAELRGNTRGAADEYRQVIDGPDADCAALAAARLGWLLADEGDTGEAERAFRSGLDRGGSRAEAWLALGLADILMRSGRSGEAAGLYEEALASDDGMARAFAALGARRLCLESELMAEAAEYARSVAENPAATSLWPAVLADEKPSTPEGRIYAISKWLTWLRSENGEYACLADQANPRQVILFENPDSLSMSVILVPRALPRWRRGEAKEILRELATMGFMSEDSRGGPLADDTESWTMNAQDKTDHDLAVLSDEIMTSLLTGRPNFTLKVDFEPAITQDPQPIPPLPDLLPR